MASWEAQIVQELKTLGVKSVIWSLEDAVLANDGTLSQDFIALATVLLQVDKLQTIVHDPDQVNSSHTIQALQAVGLDSIPISDSWQSTSSVTVAISARKLGHVDVIVREPSKGFQRTDWLVEGLNVVIVPGNGCTPIRHCNYYAWLETACNEHGVDVRLPPGEGMPDPLKARKQIWLPFIKNTLGCNEKSILIGHSSGAVAGLRYAESNKLFALFLVAAYDTDFGDELERASGYFDGPFNWDLIKENCQFIVQFAGVKDTLVSIEVQRNVAEQLRPKVKYWEIEEEDHFFSPPFVQALHEILLHRHKLFFTP